MLYNISLRNGKNSITNIIINIVRNPDKEIMRPFPLHFKTCLNKRGETSVLSH